MKTSAGAHKCHPPDRASVSSHRFFDRQAGGQASGHGFIIIELIVAMGIALLILAGLIGVFFVQNKYFGQQSEVVEIQINARAGLQMMTGELLMAGYDPTRTADAGVALAAVNAIRFTRDLSGNGDVLDAHEDITYTHDAVARQLKRNDQPLSENVDALAFRYYDTDDLELTLLPLSVADLEKVRRIMITLTAVTRDGDQSRTLSSDVVPRNLGMM